MAPYGRDVMQCKMLGHFQKENGHPGAARSDGTSPKSRDNGPA